MIDTYFRDDETLVVYFQFSNSGKYQGMSYHFTSGDGCSYCYDSTVQSNVKIAGGRVKGRIQQASKEDQVDFDITIDVPLASSDYGMPLATDGGAPGKVYADLHLALQGSDPAALKPLIVERLVSKLANSGDDVLAVLQDEHPLKSYKIIKGFVKGDRALLIIEGSNNTINLETEAHLMREQGQWRFDNEIMQLRFDE